MLSRPALGQLSLNVIEMLGISSSTRVRLGIQSPMPSLTCWPALLLALTIAIDYVVLTVVLLLLQHCFEPTLLASVSTTKGREKSG